MTMDCGGVEVVACVLGRSHPIGVGRIRKSFLKVVRRLVYRNLRKIGLSHYQHTKNGYLILRKHLQLYYKLNT